MKRKRIYWVDHDRFATKPDKATWLEIANALELFGFHVNILAYIGNRRDANTYNGRIIPIPSIDVGYAFRIVLLINICIWLLRHANRKDIIVLHPDALWITPVLALFGRKNIHLDIRTVPVEINTLKRQIDRLIFWKFPLRNFGRFVSGYSFITSRLKRVIEQQLKLEFKDYVLWQSGVNISDFKPKPGRSKDVKSTFKVFYHGTISEKRGIGKVIEAIQLVNFAHKDMIEFVLVGDGPGRANLARMAEQLGISHLVTFMGMMPYETIPDAINNADVCICPLPDREEWEISSPIKVFEYLACGKPIILTPIAAHTDIAGEYRSIVWTKGYSADDFKEAIEYAYNNISNLGSAALGSINRIDKLDWKTHGRNLADYLQDKFS
ncbi:MAG: glycosyltransferase [Gammaproteobacteria bacterium]